MLAPYLGFGKKVAYKFMAILGMMTVGVVAGVGIIIYFCIV
jgi:hypothetical protein